MLCRILQRHLLFETAALVTCLTTYISSAASIDASITEAFQQFVASLLTVSTVETAKIATGFVASLTSVTQGLAETVAGDSLTQIPETLASNIATAYAGVLRWNYEKLQHQHQLQSGMQGVSSVVASSVAESTRNAPSAQASLRDQLRFRDVVHHSVTELTACVNSLLSAASSQPKLQVEDSVIDTITHSLAGGDRPDLRAAKAEEAQALQSLQAVKHEVEQVVSPVATELASHTAELHRLQAEREELLRALEANATAMEEAARLQQQCQLNLESLSAGFAPRVTALSDKLQHARHVLGRAQLAHTVRDSLQQLLACGPVSTTARRDIQRSMHSLARLTAAYVCAEKALLSKLEQRSKQNEVEHSKLLDEAAKYRSLDLPNVADQQEARAAECLRFVQEDVSSARLLRSAAQTVLSSVLGCLSRPFAPDDVSAAGGGGAQQLLLAPTELRGIRAAFAGLGGGAATVASIVTPETAVLLHQTVQLATACGIEVPAAIAHTLPAVPATTVLPPLDEAAAADVKDLEKLLISAE